LPKIAKVKSRAASFFDLRLETKRLTESLRDEGPNPATQARKSLAPPDKRSPLMNIVLIRHAERAHLEAEEKDPLSSAGREKADETVKRLVLLHQRMRKPLPSFSAVLTSGYGAPKQTAEMLPRAEGAPLIVLSCLAPREQGSGDLTPAQLLAEANAVANDHATLAVVGHEPSISRLLCRMTGKDSRRLDRGEAVWIRGKSKEDFVHGRAELVNATRREDFAENLKDKIETKMTVCTFLAGFTIAALIEIIKDPDTIIRTSRVAAAISLTAALGLFVAAIYIYDELSMPREFWGSDTRRKPPGSTLFGHDSRLNDNLYAHMVRAWRLFFTPAVVFSLIGFFSLLLFNLRYPHLVMPERIAVGVLIGGCTVSLAAAALMYWRLRPRLATD
jgi:phosphohistidine phosphatase SixA